MESHHTEILTITTIRTIIKKSTVSSKIEEMLRHIESQAMPMKQNG